MIWLRDLARLVESNKYLTEEGLELRLDSEHYLCQLTYIVIGIVYLIKCNRLSQAHVVKYKEQPQ
jgi:hypothetical protein